MENTSKTSCSACGSWWRLPLLLVLVLAAIFFTRGRGLWNAAPKVEVDAPPASAGTAQESVSLGVDLGGGERHDFESLPWHDGMTVADLMSEATGLEVAQMGSGQGAFVRAIDGVTNEGADGKNWTYEVNGQGADRSFAVYALRPGDRVLWSFGARR